MELLCELCDRSIAKNESEFKMYLGTLRKKNDKSFYKKCTIMNPRLHEVDKMLNDYITTHNKKFDFYFVSCECKIEFDNNFTTKVETNFVVILMISLK